MMELGMVVKKFNDKLSRVEELRYGTRQVDRRTAGQIATTTMIKPIKPSRHDAVPL